MRERMQSLIYVSQRVSPHHGRISEIHDILTVSRPRNASLDVTGALVATPTHFAQILEGSDSALAEILESLERDRRHRITHLANLGYKLRRDFVGWSLAYHGEAAYVSHMLADAVSTPDFDLAAHVEPIRGLMMMFA